MKISQTNGPILHYYNGDEYASLLHLKNAGFKYVDISFWSRYTPGSRYFSTSNDVLADEYKRILEKLELVPVQSHEPFGNSLGDDNGRFYLKKTPLAIELAGKIGIPSITLHAGINVTPMSREEYMEKNVQILKALIPYAEKYGTRLLLENLAWKVDGVHLAGADDLNELLDRLNHPLFGVCWDTGHANLCNLDQYDEIKKLGSRLEGLHVHDNYGGIKAPNCDLHQLPYYGNVDFDGLITALLEIDYKGTFNFEVDAPSWQYANSLGKEGKGQGKFKQRPVFMRQEAEKFLYKIGKEMMKSYDCFEE